jgi:hypothetical protein
LQTNPFGESRNRKGIEGRRNIGFSAWPLDRDQGHFALIASSFLRVCKEIPMTTTTILIVSAIASAFLFFGGVLAWGDYYSRGARQEPSAAEGPASIPAATPEDRKAA